MPSHVHLLVIDIDFNDYWVRYWARTAVYWARCYWARCFYWAHAVTGHAAFTGRTLLLGHAAFTGRTLFTGHAVTVSMLMHTCTYTPYHDRTMVHASAPLCCCVDAVRGHPFNMNKPHMSLYSHPLPLLTLIFPLLTPYPFTRSPFLSIPSSSSLPLRPFLPIPSLPSFPYYNPPGLGETFVIPPLPLRRRRHRDKRQPPPQRPSEGGPL